MKIKTFLISVTKKIAELSGIAAAAARNGYETEKENNRLIRANWEYAELSARNEQDYLLAAEILADCVNNTVDVTGLYSIKDLSQLYWRPFLEKMPDGVWAFHYHARYRRGFGVTAEAIQRTLQMEIDRLTAVYQCPALRVFVTFGLDGTVVIMVAYDSDVLALQKVVL